MSEAWKITPQDARPVAEPLARILARLPARSLRIVEQLIDPLALVAAAYGLYTRCAATEGAIYREFGTRQTPGESAGAGAGTASATPGNGSGGGGTGTDGGSGANVGDGPGRQRLFEIGVTG